MGLPLGGLYFGVRGLEQKWNLYCIMGPRGFKNATPIASLHCVADCTRAILIAESLPRATVCPPSLPWGACGLWRLERLLDWTVCRRFAVLVCVSVCSVAPSGAAVARAWAASPTLPSGGEAYEPFE